ncbi:unnamed protein product [Didymodactylos carnosus]|uniref:Flavin-containing monooxygenase n=1 Tax=Didymodactylos carnosus TaxID=1234261 RepID=A0A815VXX2_9BILA|nr:unnamed protein product [Didymodactylos carnosus]CAF4393475.1 unnamed protein product [Didymodactylos carnosus]
MKLSVGIIGCGPSGLVTLKELLDEGHQVTVFEKTSHIGGIFTTVYQQGVMVSSNLVTMFSDFVGREHDSILENPRMMSFIEYSQYLDDYADHFNLKAHIHFETHVQSVWRDTATDKWNVRVLKHGVDQPEIFQFDRIAISSGTHQHRSMPHFVNHEQFQGKIKHLQDIKWFEDFTGKRVCVVGGGEAAGDMALESAKHGKKSFISIRKDHGAIVQRYFRGLPADLSTNRALHSNPHAFGLYQSYFLTYYQLILDFIARLLGFDKRPPVEIEIDRQILLMNLAQLGTSNYRSTYGTKNSGFTEAIVQYNCQRKPGIRELKAPATIVFDDGTEEEDIDEIVCCTGFENHFRFLETEDNDNDEIIKQVAKEARISHDLYKHCVHVLTGDQLFFIGFVRPCFDAIPPLAEMQARWFAQLCSGNVKLPSRATMLEHSKIYVEYIENQLTSYRTNRIVTLTDHLVYADDIARLISCRPNFLNMFFCDPKLWIKCHMGPIMMAHFRLCGPHAKPAESRRIILKSKWIIDSAGIIQLVMIYIHFLFYFFGNIKSCKPNAWYPVIKWRS